MKGGKADDLNGIEDTQLLVRGLQRRATLKAGEKTLKLAMLKVYVGGLYLEAANMTSTAAQLSVTELFMLVSSDFLDVHGRGPAAAMSPRGAGRRAAGHTRRGATPRS
jgi:hypothetical protein